MMATNMDSYSEVHFKDKLEEEGIKAEAATENPTRDGSLSGGRQGTTTGRTEEVQPQAREV